MGRKKYCTERLRPLYIYWLYTSAGHLRITCNPGPKWRDLQWLMGLQKWSPAKFQRSILGQYDLVAVDLQQLEWAIVEFIKKNAAHYIPLEVLHELMSNVTVVGGFDTKDTPKGRPRNDGQLSPFLSAKIREWFHEHYKDAWEALQLPGQQGRPPVPEVIGYERFRSVIRDLSDCTPEQVLGIERGLMSWARKNRTTEDCVYIAQNISTAPAVPEDQARKDKFWKGVALRSAAAAAKEMIQTGAAESTEGWKS